MAYPGGQDSQNPWKNMVREQEQSRVVGGPSIRNAPFTAKAVPSESRRTQKRVDFKFVQVVDSPSATSDLILV